jgi:CHRD domain
VVLPTAPNVEEEPPMIRRTITATLAAAVLVAALAGSALGARPVYVFQTLMTGAAEVPGPGDPDAIGHATIMTEPGNDRICWVVSWNRIDGTVFAAHIHGPATVTQPAGIVVPLFVGQAFGSVGSEQGCASGAAWSDVIDAIVADPGMYYVNVHSLPSFAGGAIRGQLG